MECPRVNLMRKLDLHDRSELIRYASIRKGLVEASHERRQFAQRFLGISIALLPPGTHVRSSKSCS